MLALLFAASTGTPAELILAVCSDLLSGQMPQAADVLRVRAAILNNASGKFSLDLALMIYTREQSGGSVR